MSDLARYYAAWGSEVAMRAGAVISADLVARLTGTDGVPREALRFRGSDKKLELPGGIELALPAASGTIARLEDITGGVTDHGALTGLGDDDHAQYHTDARAAVWLGTKSVNDLGDVAGLSAITAEVGSGAIVRALNPSLPGYVEFDAIAAPANPAGLDLRLYVDSLSGALSARDSAGAVFVLPAVEASVSNQFLVGLASDGGFTRAQPDFSNLSGAATDAQVPNALTLAQILGVTDNGFVKTGGGNGTLSIDTSTYLTTAAAAAAYQPLDSDLTAIAAITTTAYGRSFLALADAAAARTLAGVVIGTDVQAYDADLTTLGAGGSGARSFLGLAIGSDVQAYDAFLLSIAALGTAADKMIYTTGVDTAAEAAITAAGRAILDDADADAQITTLGGAAYTGTGGLVRLAGATGTGNWTLDVLAVNALNLSSGDKIRFDDGTGNEYSLFRNASNQLEVRVNTGGALTATWLFGTTFFGPSTANEDLAQTGTRFQDGYFSRLVRASSLNLTLGGTEFALGTDVVAMFTSRAAASNSAIVGINSGASAEAILRGYSNGTVGAGLHLGSNTVSLTTDSANISTSVDLTLNESTDEAAFYDQAGNAMMRLAGSAGTTGLTLLGKLVSYNNIATVSNGAPIEYAEVNSAAQSAAIGTTTVYTAPTDGFYRISAVLQITQAATTSSTLGPITIGWTDGDSAVAQSGTVFGSTQTGAGAAVWNDSTGRNTTASHVVGQHVVYANASSAITYAVAYASSGATPMQYRVRIRVERL